MEDIYVFLGLTIIVICMILAMLLLHHANLFTARYPNICMRYLCYIGVAIVVIIAVGTKIGMFYIHSPLCFVYLGF